MSAFTRTIFEAKYAHTKPDGTKETWDELADRVAGTVLRGAKVKTLSREVAELIKQRKFIPGGRYLYATGRPFHQTQNCLLLRAEDSREGWSDLLYKSSMALMTGAGIGVDYSNVRPEGELISKTGGTASGPISLMQAVNEVGRGVKQGGSRRSAIWAGICWSHKDIKKFLRLKDWPKEVRALKEKDFNFPATMDGTNISVILDDEFFRAYGDAKHPLNSLAHEVYWTVVQQMLQTAEPGFSIDVKENAGETLRNACTEVTSHDDSDICNLGSINLARIENLHDMRNVVELATAFLLAGTTYSDVPYPKVADVREKNRRLGLGLMGLHEFLLKNGKPYGPDSDLQQYLEVYAWSDTYAAKYAVEWSLSTPIKTRAIAPTGTIGIIGETTTGIEPVFCVAYKRRYLKGDTWHYQYVVDPTAKRLIDEGVPAEKVEDAYTLAEDVSRRVQFQAWVQGYVDHAISSTINLTSWGSETNNADTVRSFGEMLLPQLPNLRGVTAYPDGARGGQPITAVTYRTALKHAGEEFVERYTDVCDLSRGGNCGE